MGYFRTNKIKAQTFWGYFRSMNRKKIRSPKKIFLAKFALQTCHLKKLGVIVPHFPMESQKDTGLIRGCPSIQTFTSHISYASYVRKPSFKTSSESDVYYRLWQSGPRVEGITIQAEASRCLAHCWMACHTTWTNQLSKAALTAHSLTVVIVL